MAPEVYLEADEQKLQALSVRGRLDRIEPNEHEWFRSDPLGEYGLGDFVLPGAQPVQRHFFDPLTGGAGSVVT